ncbi:MAG: VCBS repeat-containing protein [Planctomycetota bacterium]
MPNASSPSLSSCPARAATVLGVCLGALLATPAPTPAQIGRQLAQAVGDTAVSDFGRTVTTIGDVDGDGWSDFAATQTQPASGAGHVWLLSGRDGTALRRLDAAPTETNFGQDIDALGDLDGDGVPDLIAASSESVVILSGATGARLHEAAATGPVTVAGVGDVDGDGVPDWAFQDQNGVVVASGAGSAPIHSHPPLSLTEDVIGIGDVNADGRGDYIIKSRRTFAVHSGRSGQVLWISTSTAEVAAAGDVNGDGIADLITSDLGVDVHSGRDGSLLFSLPGRGGSGLGGGVDLDADGRVDLVVADWPDGTVGIFSGTVRAYSGRTRRLLFEIFGTETGSFLGWGAALHPGFGDERRPAVLAGTPGAFNGETAGGTVVAAAIPRPGEIDGTFRAFGNPCGSASARLRAAPTVPTVGERYPVTLDVFRAPTPTTAVLLLGASNTQWGALALPRVLSQIGSFCSLRVAPDVALPMTGGVFDLQVPAVPSLLEQTVYLQAFFGSPLEASDGTALTFGN